MQRTFLLVVSLTLGISAAVVITRGGDAGAVGKDPAPSVARVDTTGRFPSDAVVLFDGTDFSQWRTGSGKPIPWTIDDEGAMVAAEEGLLTKDEFGDVQLHFEWNIPKGGNSGVKLHEWYEIQILDDYDKATTKGSTGSVYKQHAPLVNARRKAGQWQTYDIIFRAPRFDADGEMVKHGRFTVLHNGILIQDNAKILGITNRNAKPTPEYERSILFTYHGAPARFRNIWVRRLAPRTPDME